MDAQDYRNQQRFKDIERRLDALDSLIAHIAEALADHAVDQRKGE